MEHEVESASRLETLMTEYSSDPQSREKERDTPTCRARGGGSCFVSSKPRHEFGVRGGFLMLADLSFPISGTGVSREESAINKPATSAERSFIRPSALRTGRFIGAS